MQSLRDKKGFICDMDGVIYHGNFLLPASRSSSTGSTPTARNSSF